MRLQKLLFLAMLVAFVAGACGSGDRPTLDTAEQGPATETVGDIFDPLTGTSGDVVDGATQTASDLIDVGPAVALDSPLLVGGQAFTVSIIEQFGHDPASFTQGLEFDGEVLYESRGLYGQSALTEISRDTGAVIRSVAVDEDFFAEGLTRVDDRLIQLTWREGTALAYDLDSFEVMERFSYDGEGWGLCHDGEALFMSDGTSLISRRDPETFELLGVVEVTFNGRAVPKLNELECFDGLIWANVWQTDFIAVIDPSTGQVVATIDASALRASLEDGAALEVLNGIAYDPENDYVVLTGKEWPAMFAVEFEACTSPCIPAPFPTL